MGNARAWSACGAVQICKQRRTRMRRRCRRRDARHLSQPGGDPCPPHVTPAHGPVVYVMIGFRGSFGGHFLFFSIGFFGVSPSQTAGSGTATGCRQALQPACRSIRECRLSRRPVLPSPQIVHRPYGLNSRRGRGATGCLAGSGFPGARASRSSSRYGASRRCPRDEAARQCSPGAERPPPLRPAALEPTAATTGRPGGPSRSRRPSARPLSGAQGPAARLDPDTESRPKRRSTVPVLLARGGTSHR